jgi:hypothetical protein
MVVRMDPFEIQETDWLGLQPLLKSDAIVIVSENIDLLQAAKVAANDNTEQMNVWIESGDIKKPTCTQIKTWNFECEGETKQATLQKFRFIIVQPFVLVQLKTKEST